MWYLKWLLWTVSTYISGKSLDTCMKRRETQTEFSRCLCSTERMENMRFSSLYSVQLCSAVTAQPLFVNKLWDYTSAWFMNHNTNSLGELLHPWSTEQGVFFPMLSLAAWILRSFLHSGPVSTWRAKSMIFFACVMFYWEVGDRSFCPCSLRLKYFTFSSCVMLHVKSTSLTCLGLICSVLWGIISVSIIPVRCWCPSPIKVIP